MAIHYQFDPAALHELPEWTFRLNFRVPGVIFRVDVSKAAGSLRALNLDAARLQPADNRHFSRSGREFSFRIHVPDEVRRSPDGLALYEADFWRIMRRMYDLGFREVTYIPETTAAAAESV